MRVLKIVVLHYMGFVYILGNKIVIVMIGMIMRCILCDEAFLLKENFDRHYHTILISASGEVQLIHRGDKSGGRDLS